MRIERISLLGVNYPILCIDQLNCSPGNIYIVYHHQWNLSDQGLNWHSLVEHEHIKLQTLLRYANLLSITRQSGQALDTPRHDDRSVLLVGRHVQVRIAVIEELGPGVAILWRSALRLAFRIQPEHIAKLGYHSSMLFKPAAKRGKRINA